MEEKKKGKGLIVFTVILILIILGLVGYILYSRNITLDKEGKLNKLESEIRVLKNENKKLLKTSKNKEKEETESTEETKCIGLYKGTAAIYMDAETGKLTKGALAIELKADGTFDLKKENILTEQGKYKIYEGVLMLGMLPHTTVGKAEYTYGEYLHISEDCSTISDGFGSLFFDSNFVLTRQK